jgi:hypothetical protein
MCPFDYLDSTMKPAFCTCSLIAVLVALAIPSPACSTELEPDDDSAPQQKAVGVPLFNGTDLSGWEGDTELWRVRDGMIVGESPGISRNEFLATTRSFEDFELTLEFRMHGGRGNSGVQFRSRRVPDSRAMVGYQADLGERFWGCLYDEHRRRKVLAAAPAALDEVLDKHGWNTYAIRAKGGRVTLSINGLTTVDYTEEDESIATDGVIALQIHSGPAMRIDFRNLQIRELADE